MVADAGHASFDAIAEIDRRLVRLTRSSGALRLRLGTGFERLAELSGHHEMGFSSLEAYALERCERSARWVQQARGLARKVDALPAIRRALRCGRVSWSMASVIANEATGSNEEWWLAEAEHRTVRQMRQLVCERRECQCRAQGESDESDTRGADTRGVEETTEKLCALTVTVNQEDAWLFESARMVVERVGGRTMEDVVYALTAEGCTTLMPSVPAEVNRNWNEDDGAAAQRAWEAELRNWRQEAEIRCEERIAHRASDERDGCDELDKSDEYEKSEWVFADEPQEIDARIRKLVAHLTMREMAIGELAEQFWTADGWRRLGFATESQYTRERLGVSLSSVEAKRRLARAARRLSEVKAAIEKRELGYEGARLVASVANRETVTAWLERAAERTVKHLREEVDAAQMLARLTGSSAGRPPNEELMHVVECARSQIVSGRIFRDEPQAEVIAAALSGPPQTSAAHADEVGASRRALAAPQTPAAIEQVAVTDPQVSSLQQLAQALLAKAQMFSRRMAGRMRDARGRVALKLQITLETRKFYRWLERIFQRYATERMPFMRFLCRTLIETWKDSLDSHVAYAGIYARDGYRCKSPVCTRSDLTPHHLHFRSAGGDDSDENLAGLCVWCHIEGVHDRRLVAKPPASSINWEIGRNVHTRVEGRRRVRTNT